MVRAELAFGIKKRHVILKFKKLEYFVSLHPSFYNLSMAQVY